MTEEKKKARSASDQWGDAALIMTVAASILPGGAIVCGIALVAMRDGLVSNPNPNHTFPKHT